MASTLMASTVAGLCAAPLRLTHSRPVRTQNTAACKPACRLQTLRNHASNHTQHRLPSGTFVGQAPLLAKQPQQQVRRGSPQTVYAKKGEDYVEVPDRLVSSVAYLLPFFDGIRYGRFFFQQVPAAEVALTPLKPFLGFYFTFPFASLIAFLALYYTVVQNQRYSRYVRFNTLQAILVDILLFFPSLIDSVFKPTDGLSLQIYISFYNTVFFFIFACFLLGVSSCLAGRVPRLPLVADAADNQVPF
eukprot:jgi/Chlat1/6299/Chrsp44S05873